MTPKEWADYAQMQYMNGYAAGKEDFKEELRKLLGVPRGGESDLVILTDWVEELRKEDN